MLSWILLILTSIALGAVITLAVQFYVLKKYFSSDKIPPSKAKLRCEPFQLPKILLETLRTSSTTTTQEGCTALNVLFQFLFHELRDTERVRRWFRNKLTVEFEELLTRTAIGKMFGSIKVREINLGTEFPILNGIVIENVSINSEFSHIDSLDLKLNISYKGGFRLTVDANTLLGKAAFLSVKVGELVGQARLQFTRLPYTHWSFSFYEEPHLNLDVESQFQGRPLHQITTLITNQIRKAIRKKHTLPNFKLRYKPFFTFGDESSHSQEMPTCVFHVNLHNVSRLHHSTPKNVYCLIGIDPLPWIDIITYGSSQYFLLDVVITKVHAQPLGITFKEELVPYQNKVGVIVECSSQPELQRGDLLISVDGRKVVQSSQISKFIKSSAIQVTFRVERSAGDLPPMSAARKTSVSEGDSSGSSSISCSPVRQATRSDSTERRRSRKIISAKISTDIDSSHSSKIYYTKTSTNNQIITIDEAVTFNVTSLDRYLNFAIRGVDSDQSEMLVGSANVPLSKIAVSLDSLHCCQIKPPDSFAASNIQNHKLSSHNGFIPLLSYGDLAFSYEFTNSSGFPTPQFSFSATPEHVVRPSTVEKKHNFERVHLPSSSQCQFCGKKIWLKEAEQCRDCSMTCHKKCKLKCKNGTVCTGQKDMDHQGDGHSLNSTMEVTVDSAINDSHRDEPRRKSVNPEIVMTTSDTPPPQTTNVQTGTRKGISNLLATVAASAGRGLKRVGSAHSLQLPEDAAGGESLSKSLPPSPQQTPSPSRKPSLPIELNEDIALLLQKLQQEASGQDMMGFAKSSGKTLYDELDIPQRREKIQEMLNKLNTAIMNEAEVRSSFDKDMSSKDASIQTKAAFLRGKSDEKAEALNVLMMQFCACLKHLEEQEREISHENEDN